MEFVRKLDRVPFEDSCLYIYNAKHYNVIVQSTKNKLGQDLIITANPKNTNELALIVYRTNMADTVIIKNQNEEVVIHNISELKPYMEQSKNLSNIIDEINDLIDSKEL